VYERSFPNIRNFSPSIKSKIKREGKKVLRLDPSDANDINERVKKEIARKAKN